MFGKKVKYFAIQDEHKRECKINMQVTERDTSLLITLRSQGGMPGSARLRDCAVLQKITVKQAEEKRLYGAICAAPAVALVPWGLHKRKKVSIYSVVFVT